MINGEAELPTHWDALLRAALAQAPALQRDDAEWLLVHVLGLSRAGLYARLRDPVDPVAAQRFLALWRRRCSGEAHAYLTGEREFYGRSFRVTPAVLIPRADTECLLEAALAIWPRERAGVVVDAGTGSGALAISFALERSQARVYAVDYSAAALVIAQGNARALGAAVRFWRGDWLQALRPASVDLILSNPPYIAEDDPHLDALDRGGEPRSALVAAAAGLADLHALIGQARNALRVGGWLWLEHGWDQAAAVRGALAAAGFDAVRSERDFGGHERASGGQWPGV